MRILWVIIRSLLAFAGFVTIVGVALFKWSDNHPDPNDGVTSTLYPSPGGDYTAAYVQRASGFVTSPVCTDTVVVFSNGSRIEDIAGRPVYEVYNGDCDYFSESTPPPKITWTSYNELQIDIGLGKSHHHVGMKSTDASQKVAIRFSAAR